MTKNQVPTVLLTAVVALILATAAVPGAAVGAPGDPDPSFGNGGKVTTDFGGFDEADGVAVQADGKVVAAGSSGADFALARYNPDGSLDAGFGNGGRVTTDFAFGSDGARGVAIQPDGKIVAAGTGTVGGHENFALARYNPDGSLDTSFGSGGKVSTDFGGISAGFDVALAANGKIVVAGVFIDAAGGPDFAVARYNTDGSLDTSFGSGGKVITQFSGSPSVVRALAIQSDGKIVAVGSTDVDFALARYNPDGSLDASFGNGGKLTTDFAQQNDSAAAVALQPDGKIVAAGSTHDSGLFALARYNPDGSLDTSFGSGGEVTTDLTAGFEIAWGVAVAADGKIVAAGLALIDGNPAFGLARFNTDGSLDASFGNGGLARTDFGGGNSNPFGGVVIQADGKLVAAGFAFVNGSFDFALARYEGSPTATNVSIDIKPGSSTNPIKLSVPDLVPVAILTTDSFDATTVDPSSVCFGDNDNPGQRDCTEAHGTGHIQDVNGDGRPDLILHYEVKQTGIDPGDTTACLTGKTRAGVNIQGCDSITTI